MKRFHVPFSVLAIALVLPLLGFDCGGGKECVYDGKTFADGADYPSTDGCNTCSCSNGSTVCTERACATSGKWFNTCGDPVCSMHKTDPNIPPCTTQKVGDACPMLNVKCDPNDACNVHLICATTDPTKNMGGCPISRAKYKRDIHYLDDSERASQGRALLDMKLATYRYRTAGPTGLLQLGFIIDDVGAGPPVSPDGETVNLYGYTSMAVAAIQAQQKEIDALKAELAALKQTRPARRR